METAGDDAIVETVEHAVYRLLTKTFILLDDSDRQFFAEHGLSTRQYWALQHLDEQRGCSMVELSRVLFTDKSNVTGIIDRLERLHLVTRTIDPRDRRVQLVTLTPQGRLLRDTLQEQHNMRIQEYLSVIESSHLPVLRDYLQAISQNIEAYLERLKAAGT
ncbi:MAG: MarR family transcriptional regulator [Ktedonobacteraceae bacterium]|nr:MarR family transcriptional regulator [Ktedonobacteraceae bacterium]